MLTGRGSICTKIVLQRLLDPWLFDSIPAHFVRALGTLAERANRRKSCQARLVDARFGIQERPLRRWTSNEPRGYSVDYGCSTNPGVRVG
jgi:hypothetical protein